MPPRTRGQTPCPSIAGAIKLTSRCTPLWATTASTQTQPARTISTTPCRAAFTKNRRDFRLWERTQGKKYQEPSHSPTYISVSNQPDTWENTTKPFPLNATFKSQPVLSEQGREVIWEKVMRNGVTIKSVSAELGVDVRRVAAVVRLKEIEKEWAAQGKTLARPYSRAVLSMVPSVSFFRDQQNDPFEPINELHMHKYTRQQVFWPTSESRKFTRADAAKAFHDTLLPADKRVPHPELIQMERDLLEGKSLYDSKERFTTAAEESERKVAEKVQRQAVSEEKNTLKVESGRFQFRFKQINAEDVGKHGRSRKATGWRYGVPFYDRRRGEVKIPTQVPEVGTYHNQQRA